MFHNKITVFTPTYNRAHTLERLYKSLQAQTYKNFEWLIVDDGSTDDTENLVKKWQAENNFFPVRYFKKENGGKHTAINFGLDFANGEFFFTADSDDYLTDDALQKVSCWFSHLPKDESFCGVAGNMGLSANSTPNRVFENDWIDTNLLERYTTKNKLSFNGERAFVFFTEIHRKYKYPVFKSEKFITEAVAWNRMAQDGHKIRVFNEIICIYKYLEGGLTMSGGKIFIENPEGYGLWLREKANFSNYSLMRRLKMVYSYYLEEKDRISLKEIAQNIGSSVFLIYFFSVLYAIKQKINKTRDLKRSKNLIHESGEIHEQKF